MNPLYKGIMWGLAISILLFWAPLIHYPWATLLGYAITLFLLKLLFDLRDFWTRKK